MRKQMFSNRFTVIVHSDGECGIRFMTVWPVFGNVVDEIIPDKPSGFTSHPQKNDIEAPTSELVDDQHVFLSLDSLKDLRNQINSAIEKHERDQ